MAALMKFKVLRGSHSVMQWVPCTDEEVNADLPGIVKKRDGKFYKHIVRNYEKGEIIETDVDLAERHNTRGPLGPKFLKIDRQFARGNPWENLEKKSVEQLRALALFEEIDLGDVKNKKDILAILLAVRDGKPEPAKEVKTPAAT